MAIQALLVILTVLLALLFLGVPISYAIAVSSLTAILSSIDLNVAVLTAAQRTFVGMSKFSLTAIPFFILAGNIMNQGGIAIGTSTSGTVKSITQLLPVVIDKVGAASVMSGNKKYETADEMQVYLWYKGTYCPTTLSQVNGEEYTLIGWYDGGLRAAGGKIRVLIAVRKN